MAISILRPSISPSPQPQHFLYSIISQKVRSISLTGKKQSFLRCASSDSAPPTRQEMSLSVGMYLIPHPNKVEKGGEDAFFVSSDNGEVIAVADGVSGWAEKNVDPALFSRELVANVSSLLGNSEVNYDPRFLIKGAHAATSSIGSATIIVSIFENGILKIASVGDCGLRIIRKGQMIFSTFPLEHYFDCPYQLSSEAVSQTYLDAIVSMVDLQIGDIIIMGSDGLFDNIFDREIVSIVTTHDDVSNAGTCFLLHLTSVLKQLTHFCGILSCLVSMLAKALADLARNHSVDTKFDSPFSLEARARGFDVPWWKKVFGMKLTGGKLDDITVIVGKVKSS